LKKNYLIRKQLSCLGNVKQENRINEPLTGRKWENFLISERLTQVAAISINFE